MTVPRRPDDLKEPIEVVPLPGPADGAPTAPPTGRHLPATVPRAGPFLIRPSGPVRVAAPLSIARAPDSVAAQQYRLLKFKLKERVDPRIIGVTSPSPGEGKTTTAANLGLALAEGKRSRILLLDLNLRSPTLAALFGLTVTTDVAEQLHRRRREPEARWEVLELGSSLHLMASARAVENPAPLLNSEMLSGLVTDLVETYDYIVVDLPAILLAADVKIIGEHLDGLVLVCQAGLSTRTALTRAIAQLGVTKLHGIVMREVPEADLRR